MTAHQCSRAHRSYRRAMALAWLLPLAAQGADGLELGGEDFLEELPVVLTVTRLPQSRAELPAAVTVIDREMIAASGAVELTDLLRLVAGFQVGHYHDTDGPRVAVTYHGSTDQYSRRMQVLIDGRSVYTWGTGGAEWPDLPLAIDDIERIEVSRGPNGVTYGSNAFLGVINIVTRHPTNQQSQASVTLDDDDYREGRVRYVGGSGDLTFRLSGSLRADDGFEDYTAPNGRSYELNDDSSTASLAFRGDYRGGVNDYLTVQLGGAAGPRQVGFSYDPFDPTRDRVVSTHYQQLQWKHVVDSDSEFNAQLYHNLHKVEDSFDTAALTEIYNYLYYDVCVPVPSAPECAYYPFDAADLALMGLTEQTLPRDTGMQSERYNLELSHRLRLGKTLRLVWGGELRLDEVTAADYFDSGARYSHHLSRLFFNTEWSPTPRWVVNLGEMVEQSNLFGTLQSPRLALNRLVGTTGYMRLAAGRAFRLPTAVEEYSDFTIRYADGTLFHWVYDSPSDIEAERMEAVEFAFGAEGRGGGYEVKLFREAFTNEIGVPENLAELPPHWTIVNAGERTIEGVELQLTARSDGALASLAYAATRASGYRIDEINPERRRDVDESVPQSTLNLLLSQRVARGMWLGLNYHAVSPMRFYSGDKTEGVRALDLTLSKAFRVAEREAKMGLLLKGLLGPYYDFERETISTRRAFVTLQLAL